MKTTPIRRSAAALTIRAFLLLFLVDTVYALLFLVFLNLAPPTDYYLGFIIFLWISHTVKSFIVTVLLVWVLLQWLGKTYLIDGRHLIVHSGIYAVSEKVYELAHLRQVKVHQDWFGRLFHFGNLTLQISTSGFHETVELDDVAYPALYEKELVEEFR